MKTVEKWALALNKAISFVDQFGDNFGEPKLCEIVKISVEGKKLVVKNQFGTSKSFAFGNTHVGPIFDEVAAGIECFKTKYVGDVFAHQGYHSGKIITTISSKLVLENTVAARERTAIIVLKGTEVTIRYEITENFSEFL